MTITQLGSGGWSTRRSSIRRLRLDKWPTTFELGVSISIYEGSTRAMYILTSKDACVSSFADVSSGWGYLSSIYSMLVILAKTYKKLSKEKMKRAHSDSNHSFSLYAQSSLHPAPLRSDPRPPPGVCLEMGFDISAQVQCYQIPENTATSLVSRPKSALDKLVKRYHRIAHSWPFVDIFESMIPLRFPVAMMPVVVRVLRMSAPPTIMRLP